MAAGRDGKRAKQAYNGAVRAQLADIQRARMLAGMLDVASERGAGNVSVADVVERSGVSRRTFYEQFTDREDCFLAAFDQALALASQRVVTAYESQERWADRVRAGLGALLAFLDEQPLMGRLLIVESQAGGPRVLEARGRVLAGLTGAIDAGRAEAKGSAPGPLVAEGTVGGVLSVLASRLSGRSGAGGSRTHRARRSGSASERGRSDAQPLLALTGSLMSMIVLPYLGAGAAKREQERPAPMPAAGENHSSASPPLGADPFKEAGMRLTYRTVRVLGAIADHPGASNRLIGDLAGTTDQGQISKLLKRLARVGLIENTGADAGKGAPNSWALTEKGAQIVEGIRVHVQAPSGQDAR
jgi:AcrR family transcriptional regulator